MADNSSLSMSFGSSSVTTTGTLNTAVLAQISTFITNSNLGFSTTATDTQFFTPTGNTSTSLGAGAPGVITNFSATLVGGGPSTVVIADGASSNLNYTGAAGFVFADGTGTIVNSAAAATINALNGVYQVVGLGKDQFLLGSGASSVTATSLGANSRTTLQGGVSYTGGVGDTIVAAAGANTVISGGSTTFFGAGGSNVFASKLDASTFIGGSGADTIFTALSHDLIYVGATSDLIVTQGGTDTLAGGTVAPTVFAGPGEDVVLFSTTAGGILVDNGQNSTVDGSGSNGGNQFFATASYGSSTLIGATSGAADSFYVSNDTTSGATITIKNFHSGDSVYLTGFSAADNTKAAAAVAAGTTSFTLSDGTTLSFVNGHPTSGTNGHLT